ncbi:MAG: LysM peptidoglycan-binding domain-containing protein [Gemmatimonadota bacterium]
MRRVALLLAAAVVGCAPVGGGVGPASTPVPQPSVDELLPMEIPEPSDAELRTDSTAFEAPAAVDIASELLEADAVDPQFDEILSSPLRNQPEIRERIDFWVNFWSTRGSEHFQRYLERMGRYQPLVDEEIDRLGLPRTLRYLPIVESGYNPGAVSRVSAVGLWQFMSGTARFKGLQVDGLVDERLDPVASTPVALDYLAELREQFGSWFMALAAYNSGPGRIGGIIRRNAPDAPRTDSLFWALSDKMPNETSHFVPRLFAATEIAMDPERYGFRVPQAVEPFEYETVEVDDAVSLDVVAELVGVEEAVIQELNPHLRQRVTPPGHTFTVRVPPGRTEGFAARLADVPQRQRVTFLQHRVARGETLSHIAARYGIRVSTLQAANPSVNPRRLRIGQNLIIPTAGVDRARIAAAAPTAPASTGRAEASEGGGETAEVAVTSGRGADVTHVVQPGENPWTISRRYGVTVDELLAWNSLSKGETIYPGRRLSVRGAKVVVYRVQSGDTLSGIAQRHGVSARALAEANGLTLRSVIRPGDEVKIPVGGR